MATTYALQVLQPGVLLTGALASIYGPGTVNAVVRAATFANTSGTATTLTLAIKRANGTVTTLVPGITIQANSTYVCRELVNQMLATGDQLQAMAGTGGVVTATVTGAVF